MTSSQARRESWELQSSDLKEAKLNYNEAVMLEQGLLLFLLVLLATSVVTEDYCT